MPVTNRYGLYLVNLNTGTDVPINGIVSQNVRLESTVRRESHSGEVYSRFASLTAQKAGASFTSEAIKAVLDAIPTTGFDISSLTTGLELFGQKWAAGGTRTGGSTDVKDTIKLGVLCMRRLSCTHQGDATIECEAVAQWNGTDTEGPILRVANVGVPSGLAEGARFTLGKIVLGGITITHYRSLEIDFGLEIVSEGSESEIWDRFVTIRRIMPRITVRGINLAHLTAVGGGGIPLIGLAGTQANTSIFLRKRTPTAGSFVADATAEHILLTAAGYITVSNPHTASGLDASEIELAMDCVYDGTNAPITKSSTAIAIT